MSESASTPHSGRYHALARDALRAVERHTKERGGDHFCDYFGCSSVQPLALAVLHLEEQLEGRDDLLRRLREWDMLNSYIGGDGKRKEPTADAAYWRAEIDRVSAPNPASAPAIDSIPDPSSRVSGGGPEVTTGSPGAETSSPASVPLGTKIRTHLARSREPMVLLTE